MEQFFVRFTIVSQCKEITTSRTLPISLKREKNMEKEMRKVDNERFIKTFVSVL